MEDLNLLNIPNNKIKQLNSKNIFTISDLINFYPRKYYDFKKNTYIKDIKENGYYSIIGTVKEVVEKPKLIIIKIQDDINWNMNISFFGMNFVKELFKVNDKFVFCGNVNVNDNGNYTNRSMSNPLIYSSKIKDGLRILPVYSKINGMSSDYFLKCINSGLAVMNKEDYLEQKLVSKYKLMSNQKRIWALHNPSSFKEIEEAKKRCEFDDLFKFNFNLYKKEKTKKDKSSFVMTNFDKSRELINNLPFDLTEGQRTALRKMSISLKRGDRLNALVQADVGAGKTIVAIFLMLIACNNGFQSALMCPTTVLAEQHYEEVKAKLEPLGVRVAYLSSTIKKREKNKILKQLRNNEIDIIVGTHAIISKDVVFNNLSLIVVDEEHRFGVAQREALVDKSKAGVHSVSMSATPIPRSLALTMYGDSIEIIDIKSMPNGRLPIKTSTTNNDKEAYRLMKSEIDKGRQCYVVCPFIEDNEDLSDVESLETAFKNIKSYFKNSAKIAMISGNMSKDEISLELNKFKNKEYDIILATTIIEVGVNVPNATVILVKNADRFGLAQLHQLRGRVGRGVYQSYCILQSELKTDFAREKINAMCETTDGFKIAIKDLELRGAGDFIGNSQSGFNNYVELMIANPKLNESIKNDIKEIYNSPGRLNHYKSLYLNEE